MIRRPLLAAALIALLPARVEAFCRTTTCDVTKGGCPPSPQDPSCPGGQPLQWPLRCLGVSLHEAASKQVAYAEFDRVTRAAFGAWNTLDCAGGKPSISVEVLGPVACGQREFNPDRGNANIVLFQDTSWPYPGATSVFALTTITYNTKTGVISDADVEINASPGKTLTTTDSDAQVDLQSILTHEAGHFLGLGHTAVQSATMFPDYEPTTVSLRDLDPDDVAGLCAAYPPDRPGLGACDPRAATPSSAGFSAQCSGADVQPAPAPPAAATGGEAGDEGSCAMKRGASDTGAWWGVVTLVFVRRLFGRARPRRRDDRGHGAPRGA